jgi:hypothetical protein
MNTVSDESFRICAEYGRTHFIRASARKCACTRRNDAGASAAGRACDE